jgi:hypothetical protein
VPRGALGVADLEVAHRAVDVETLAPSRHSVLFSSPRFPEKKNCGGGLAEGEFA